MIYVACHKDCEIPDFVINNKDYTLIKLQDFEFSNKEIKNFVSDTDSENNLRYLNPFLNELTAFNYIFKNCPEDEKYIGFCHYRRYFSFDGVDYASQKELIKNLSNSCGFFTSPYQISSNNTLKEDIKNISIRRCFSECKIFNFSRAQDQKDGTDFYIIFGKVFELLCCHYPDYIEDFVTVMNQDSYIMFNMFFMKRDYALDYICWLLNIMGPVADFMYEKNQEQELFEPRLVGYFAEKLLLVWIIHQIRTDKNFDFKYIVAKLYEDNFTQEELKQTLECITILKREDI